MLGSVLFATGALLGALGVVAVVVAIRFRCLAATPRRCVVLVLGDIGRSPRMTYHAECISRSMPVDIVGYVETTLPERLQTPDITVHRLSTLPPLPSMPLRSLVWLVIYGPAKFLHLGVQLLLLLLFKLPRYTHIITQNPPCLPSFAVLVVVRALAGIHVTVDWHNLGYSIVTNVHGFRESSPLVSLLRLYELGIPRLFDAHLTVTKALKAFLVHNGYDAARITVFHDRPPSLLVRGFVDRVALLGRLLPTFPEYAHEMVSAVVSGDRSVACAVSSTSWTPDEDFGLLFDALVAYEKDTRELPRLLIFITGKGPLLEHYKGVIKNAGLKRVCIVPVWLAHADYPEMLASCDFGISLHASSSKLDLPMKILDMFGCALPVLALDYPTLREELVTPGVNGETFCDATELLGLLVQFTADGCAVPARLKENFAETASWAEHWEKTVRPLFPILS